MKKKNLQKLFAAMLVGMMVAGTLAGCGNDSGSNSSSDGSSSAEESTDQNNGTDSDSDSSDEGGSSDEGSTGGAGMDAWEPFADTVNLRIAVFDRSYEVACDDNYWTNWVQENFGDKYNINVEYVGITRSDTPTAYALLAADQNLPTIIFEYDYDKMAGWVDDGYIQSYDLDQFKEVAPTYYAMMEEENVVASTEYDGDTYFILGKRPYRQSAHTFVTFYRADWLEELGYVDADGNAKYPDTYAEQLEMCQKLVDGGYCQYPLGGAKIAGAGVDQNYGFRTYPQNELEWATMGSYQVPAMGSEANKKLVQRENEKYNLGYLNPEFYLRENADNETDFVNGDMLTYGAYFASSMSVLDAFYEQNPDGKLAIWYTPGVIVDDEGVSNGYYVDAFGAMLGFGNKATEDEIKAGMMYLEWLCQDENLMAMQWGIEGVTYEIVDGIPQFIEGYDSQYAQGYNTNVDYWAFITASKSMGDIETDLKLSCPQGYPDSDDFYEQLLKHYNGRLEVYAAGYSHEDCLMPKVDSVTEYGTTLYNKYAEYRENLTKCAPEEFDALYEQYTQEYLNAGFQKIIDEKTELYNAGKTTKLD